MATPVSCWRRAQGAHAHETLEPVDAFEAHRGFLLELAYRMTGSLADAEHIVREADLRCERSDVQHVTEPRALLATAVAAARFGPSMAETKSLAF